MYCSIFVSYEQKSLVAKVQRREMPDMGMLFLNIKVRRSHLISDSLNEVSFACYLCAITSVIFTIISQQVNSTILLSVFAVARRV